MRHKIAIKRKVLLAFFITFLIIMASGLPSAAASDSKAIFTVQWYDVGQDALEGLTGVKKVEKGFRGSKEINTVYYDSDLISVEEMENALKEAGTFIGTAE